SGHLLASGGAEDVVVAEDCRAVTQRPGRRQDNRPGIRGLLTPGIEGRAVGATTYVRPHTGAVVAGGDGVDVVAEELVVQDPALRRTARITERTGVLRRPGAWRTTCPDRGRLQHSMFRPRVGRGRLEGLRERLRRDVHPFAVRADGRCGVRRNV